MFALVMVAYITGENPVVKVSPDLYPNYKSCESSAINVLNMLADEMSPKQSRNTRIVFTCAEVPKEA